MTLDIPHQSTSPRTQCRLRPKHPAKYHLKLASPLSTAFHSSSRREETVQQLQQRTLLRACSFP